jgi:phosphoglycerate-specific signal transduction histidine kinase
MMKFGIGFRLTAGFIVIGLLMLGVAAMGLTGNHSLNQGLAQIVEKRYPKVELLREIIDEVTSVSIAIRNALIADKPDEIQAQLTRVNAGRETLSGMLQELDKSFASADAESLRLQQALHDHNGAYLVELVKVSRAVAGGNKDTAQSLLLEALSPKQVVYLPTCANSRCTKPR